MGGLLFRNVVIQITSTKRKCLHEWELQGHLPKVEIKKFWNGELLEHPEEVLEAEAATVIAKVMVYTTIYYFFDRKKLKNVFYYGLNQILNFMFRCWKGSRWCISIPRCFRVTKKISRPIAIWSFTCFRWRKTSSITQHFTSDAILSIARFDLM